MHVHDIRPTSIFTRNPTARDPQKKADMTSSAISIPAAEANAPTPTISLLSLPPQSTKSKKTLVSIIASVAIIASIALAVFLFLSSSSSQSYIPPRRPTPKIPKPVVILISADGFRYGYQYKTSTPNIGRLIANGTEAYPGLIPVFPTLTFPNHYSIATGLYPAHHGIINNRFQDPLTGDIFTTRNNDPKWWLGEPIWVTAANQGLKAATYFWPGSEVHKGKWDCPATYCMIYNRSVPFEERVDTVIDFFGSPDIPSFINLYFEDPDSQGHRVGPDDPEITKAVSNIDEMIGRLIEGLEKKGVFDQVHIILVGDHGMVGNCDAKVVALEDLAHWIEIPESWVQSVSPLLAIRPPPGVGAGEVVARMRAGLSSGLVENGARLKVFLKEELPERLHYSASERIPPIIGLLDEGYKVEVKRSNSRKCGGAHGYDNAYFSMRTIFVAHGPRFHRGRKVPSFENVQIYNLLTAILNIKGAENNGTSLFPNSILRSTAAADE
ncbi:hypothetical protein ACLOJK_037820 [Asimina triloba]